MEQQIPSWLNDAVLAAGMAAVYNADDWSTSGDNPPAPDTQIPYFFIPG
jgi:hypothetical protein